ncbi:MAG: hypothetical protein EON52_07390, partial [Actinomycetales bacterium]
MKTITRRLAALAAAPLLAGALVAAPGSAQAANGNATSAGYWLGQQLTNGLVFNEQYEYNDYGLTIDVLQALLDTDTQPAKRTEIVSALRERVNEYTSAGGTGKFITAVQDAGAVPTSFGGVNLVQRLEDKIVGSDDPEAGRGRDYVGDFSSTLTQSLIVRGLSGVDSNKAAAAVSYLLKQQCADGGFREAMFTEAVADDPETPFDDSREAVDRTCGDSTTAGDDGETVDATAFAVRALIEAKIGAEVPDVQAPLSRAVLYLLKQQQADGSFRNDGASNSNSTGLAAAALSVYGKAGPADLAAAWLVKRQATKAAATGNQLAGELGAIAFDNNALADGKADGIGVPDRDQWIRATSQAAAGIDALLPAKKLSIKPKYSTRPRSAQQLVTVTGLAA